MVECDVSYAQICTERNCYYIIMFGVDESMLHVSESAVWSVHVDLTVFFHLSWGSNYAALYFCKLKSPQ